ncbi:putative F-box protein At3g16210 [Nicotiana tabacum]|uniref:F-box protein At3g16210 n=1 Tax=Nicotiana tabacum TaxID=4097 RepID=A0AC58RNR3_TOBAC
MPHNFPDDIVVDILLKLLVKSLGKFKLVCKSWRSLIEDRQFIKQHRDGCQSDINCHRILLACWYRSCYLDCYSIDAPLRHDSVVSPLELPFQDIKILWDELFTCDSVFVNSCNGLSLLCFSSDIIVLWNPTIRESRIIPSPIPDANWGKSYYSLGHVSSFQDYEIVKSFEHDHEIIQCLDLKNEKIEEILYPDGADDIDDEFIFNVYDSKRRKFVEVEVDGLEQVKVGLHEGYYYSKYVTLAYVETLISPNAL